MEPTRRILFSLVCLVLASFSPALAGYEVKTIVEPGPFHGVHGLAFGPDGALYAGDIMGSTIHRVNIDTGEHTAFVDAPFGMADDLGFAPAGTEFEGTLIWTAVALGQLYAQAPGGKPRLISGELPSINTVGYAPDGRLYVTQTGGRHKTLWHVDLSAEIPLTKVWDKTGGLNGFTIASDGFLYGPQADLGRVIKFNLETKEIDVVAEGFEWPTAVEIDSKGQLYVLDFNAGTVTRVNKESGEMTKLAALESGLDNMAIGPIDSPYADKLYVSSIGGNAIYELDTKTNKLRTVVSGHLTAPGGIAVSMSDTTNLAYIADMFSLREVDLATGNVRTITPISGSSSYPTTVTTGKYIGKDVVVTASWFTGQIQFVDPTDGAILKTESKFAAPHGVAMLADESLIVVEAARQEITRVHLNGERSTISSGSFSFPTGLAVKENLGLIYVSDSVSGTISSVELLTGAIVEVSDDFVRPEGIVLLSNGNLAVVDSLAKTVFELDIDTGKKTPIAIDVDLGLEVLPPQPSTWIFNGIAKGKDGTLYLSADTQTSLLALEPIDDHAQ